MRPSTAHGLHRDEIRRIVAANRGLNPRVSGSAPYLEDTGSSDLLIDPADGLSLFDIATIALAIEDIVHAKVDVRTPEDLPFAFRSKTVAEAQPV